MINKAEQSLKDQLVNRILGLEQAVRELKTANQPIGGDTLNVITTGTVFVGPFTMAAGTAATFNQRCNPGAGVVTVWNYAVSIYIDTFDHQHTWPSVFDGTGTLTLAQRNMVVMQWLDFEDTNDTTGQRMFKTRVQNNDSVSHDIFYQMRGVLPKQTGSS
jgi:hypothetical protein